MNRISNFKRIFLISICIDVAVFLIVLFFFARDMSSGSSDWQSDWLVLPITLGVFIITGGIIWMVFRPMLRQQEIAQKGAPAMAVLLDYWDTGTTINDDPQVGLELEVHSSRLAPYQVKTKAIISRLDLGLLRKGAAVKVTYLPEDPQQIAFLAFATPQDELPADMEPLISALSQADVTQARLAELDELRLQHMISETDYQRRKDELTKSHQEAG